MLAVASAQTYDNNCESTTATALQYCCRNRDGSPNLNAQGECANSIPNTRRCDGNNDCPGATGTVSVTANGVRIADDEIGCGSLADEIIQNRISGINMDCSTQCDAATKDDNGCCPLLPPATRPGSDGFGLTDVDSTCDEGEEDGENCFPNASTGTSGVFFEGVVNEVRHT